MVITIGAEKGGVAKTRLATHIAALAATEGVDVVLLDTDKQGSAMSWSRIRNEEGVTPSIPVLALPANPARELANLANKYTLVVVDIGAQNYRTMRIRASSGSFEHRCRGPDQQEVESTLNVFSTLKDMGQRHESGEIPAYVVLTRVSPVEGSKATAELRNYLKSEDIRLFDAQIPQREAWRATGKTGRAVHELKGRDRSKKAIDEMEAVYREIIERINGGEEE
ncbi:nucleotide-binding protein [Burkholderia ubonensis]|uniref:nucleotide-binding protein n=1 Tax=Burkholderia ubonensis TaxID=101571 RepID=UPI0008FD963F|nr:AAA family ATPase [Burkholderia ubonensis]